MSMLTMTLTLVLLMTHEVSAVRHSRWMVTREGMRERDQRMRELEREGQQL